jgi:hypothetical protein
MDRGFARQRMKPARNFSFLEASASLLLPEAGAVSGSLFSMEGLLRTRVRYQVRCIADKML